MSTVLPFVTRAAYEDEKWERIAKQASVPDAKMSELVTPKELFDLYKETTLTVCQKLVGVYKTSGRWDKTCNDKMTQVVQDLLTLCKHISEKTPNPPTTIPIEEGHDHDQNAG